MIDLYTWETSNGRKASVMLEECGLDYRVVPVDIDRGEQQGPAYRDILPAGKIPAIVDHDATLPDGSGPLLVFETGAILLYLAAKAKCLLPTEGAAHSICLQWFMFGMSTLGPSLQQLHHFNRRGGDPVTVAVERYAGEAARLYRTLDRRLASVEYLAGDGYTVADIAVFPWIARHDWQRIDLAAYPHVRRWYTTIGRRPAVQRGLAVPRQARDGIVS